MVSQRALPAPEELIYSMIREGRSSTSRCRKVASKTALLREQPKKNLIRVIAGIILIGGTCLSISRYQAEQRAAITLLASASTEKQLQEVISKCPRSHVAASALLLLAAEQRRLGKVRASSTTYERFLSECPKHSLASAAALGIAENTLTAGDYSVGLEKLQTLVAKYPSSYTASFSLYTQAELLIMMQPGKIPEAKKLLKHLTSQFPDSIFSKYSSKLLFLLNGG